VTSLGVGNKELLSVTTQRLTKIAVLRSVCYQPFVIRHSLLQTINTHGHLLYQ